jgi:hypothetical protein
MVFSIKYNNDNDSIDMMITGCHDPSCNKKNGCGEFEHISKPFHPKLVSPLGRLFLHLTFNRMHRIENILKKFEEFFDIEENKDIHGLKIMKDLIIEDCNTDNDWKVCKTCYEKYKNGTRKFEDVYYIVPKFDLCEEHITSK